MPLEIRCATCGEYFTPSKGDILSGQYRLCDQCRNPPASSGLLIAEPAAARASADMSGDESVGWLIDG